MNATWIKNMDGWNGDAALYKLDSVVSTYDGDTAEHVIVSAAQVFGAPETYIFAATADGEVISWGELPGSMKGTLSHHEALDKLASYNPEPKPAHKLSREILVDGEQQVRWAWEYDDLSTNIAAYLVCYAVDPNVYWLASTGHTQNVLDELIEYRAEQMDRRNSEPQCSILRGEHVCQCGTWKMLTDSPEA
jgi:hypothetical protein